MVILERVTDFTTNSTNFNQRIGSPKRSHFGALKTGNIGLKYVEYVNTLNFEDKNGYEPQPSPFTPPTLLTPPL